MKFQDMPYKRVDKDSTIKACREVIDAAEHAKDGKALCENHRRWYAIQNDMMTNLTLAQIRHSMDTSDTYYSAENDYYDDLLPELEVYTDAYRKAIFRSPFRADLEEQIGAVAFKSIELSLKAFDEALVPLMQEENALATEYDKLIAAAKIPFRGEEHNLPMMWKFAQDDDREVRKEAWRAISGYFLSVTDEIDRIYDRMVKNRTEQARLMGYENFIELGYYRMNRMSYDRGMVEDFRKQVKEHFVPFVTDVHKRRKERIGVDSLKYYDNGVYFMDGNPGLSVSQEELIPTAQKMYHELSGETGEYIDYMVDGAFFDIFTRPNKQQGGYMTYLPNYKAPFIFGNCNGTSDDVGLLTHECGHAFQGYVTRNEEVLEHLDLTMETAEIHSMAMEYFTLNWMDLFFGDRADDYRTLQVEDALIFIPYGCMVDEFQHIVYEHPEMTPAERKEVWAGLEKVYRPHLDYDDDPFFSSGGFWQKQLHIFALPFYYIDYVLASICAMQYYSWMQEDLSTAWDSYRKLCGLSARHFYPDLLKEVGLRSPFEEGFVAELVGKLR